MDAGRLPVKLARRGGDSETYIIKYVSYGDWPVRCVHRAPLGTRFACVRNATQAPSVLLLPHRRLAPTNKL